VDETTDPAASYAELADALAGRIDADPPGRGFGAGVLKVGGRIFATLTVGRRLALKLPEARVDELAAEGVGEHWDKGDGRPMRQWLHLEPGTEDRWLDLAGEALTFVAGQAPRRGA
jgi:hypothetical protein